MAPSTASGRSPSAVALTLLSVVFLLAGAAAARAGVDVWTSHGTRKSETRSAKTITYILRASFRLVNLGSKNPAAVQIGGGEKGVRNPR